MRLTEGTIYIEMNWSLNILNRSYFEVFMILSTEKRVNEKQKQYRDELPQKLNISTAAWSGLNTKWKTRKEFTVPKMKI